MSGHVRATISTSLATLTMVVALSAPAAPQTPDPAEREVSFRNGSVELRGSLLLPAGKSPPTVVFLHGSGPHERAGFRSYAEEFARLGFASLFFDKRGSGESGGSWITASLDDLAGDAVAAVEYLRAEETVDPQAIGFWGVSQAGWVAPLAASRVDDIAFMILISGGGASPRESEMFSYEHQFDEAGLTAAEKDRAREVLASYFDFLETGNDRTGVVAGLDEIRGGSLDPLAVQLSRILPSDENRPNWSWVAAHDPAPYIERLTCPVLLLFGEADTNHPTGLAVRRWRDAFDRADNDRASLVVFPGAGHGIRMREGYTGPGRAPFADGYAEVQVGWLWRHVGRGRR